MAASYVPLVANIPYDTGGVLRGAGQIPPADAKLHEPDFVRVFCEDLPVDRARFGKGPAQTAIQHRNNVDGASHMLPGRGLVLVAGHIRGLEVPIVQERKWWWWCCCCTVVPGALRLLVVPGLGKEMQEPLFRDEN